MKTNNHPAHGPVSLDRLHQISEILSKAAAQSDGGNLGYAMADAVKVIDGAIAAFGVEPVAWWTGPEPTPTGEIESIHDHETGSHSIPLYPFHNAPPAPVVPDEIQKLKDGRGFKYVKNGIHYSVNYANGWNQCRAAMLQGSQPVSKREQVRREHAEWSDKTFGDVGPVGPLKHLSKEALEAAAEPDDLSEWADMQFLLWDAQRRAGISDGEITAAMEEKLKVNMARQWPEPKDGEPRLHIKEQSEQEKK